MPRFKARDLRLGVVGGEIRGDNLAELAQMATFSPLGFTIVDTRGRKTAWLSERMPAVAQTAAAGMWGVRFRRIRDHSLAPDQTVEDATRRLVRVLTAARDLARLERTLAPWEPHVARALATLESSERPGSEVDILPMVGYSDSAHRLVAAVRQSWILGDVGSWNDTKPADKTLARAHRKITGELYACLVEGVIAAVNDGLRG